MNYKYAVGETIVTTSLEPRDELFVPDMKSSLGKQLSILRQGTYYGKPAYLLSDNFCWYEHWLNPIEVGATVTIENEEFLKALGM